MSLCQVAFDSETVLLVLVSRLIDMRSLSLLGFEKALNSRLYNLSPLFHPTSKCGERLFKLRFHLAGDQCMLLAHRFNLSPKDIEACTQRASLSTAQWLAT